MRRVRAILVGALLGAALAGCDGLPESKPETVRSADARSEIVIPGTWSRVRNLHSEAGIQVGNPFLGYAIVLSELKHEFPEDMTLDEFMDAILVPWLEGSGAPATSSATVPLTIDGRPALQRQIQTRVDGDPVRLLVTVVDGPKLFHQILVWTSPSDFVARLPGFQEMVSSFRELDPLRTARAR
jgi:hypothetical protein